MSYYFTKLEAITLVKLVQLIVIIEREDGKWIPFTSLHSHKGEDAEQNAEHSRKSLKEEANDFFVFSRLHFTTAKSPPLLPFLMGCF